jgi:hypothetical protein
MIGRQFGCHLPIVPGGHGCLTTIGRQFGCHLPIVPGGQGCRSMIGGGCGSAGVTFPTHFPRRSVVPGGQAQAAPVQTRPPVQTPTQVDFCASGCWPAGQHAPPVVSWLLRQHWPSAVDA